jgi:hypothetical protein
MKDPQVTTGGYLLTDGVELQAEVSLFDSVGDRTVDEPRQRPIYRRSYCKAAAREVRGVDYAISPWWQFLVSVSYHRAKARHILVRINLLTQTEKVVWVYWPGVIVKGGINIMTCSMQRAVPASAWAYPLGGDHLPYGGEALCDLSLQAAISHINVDDDLIWRWITGQEALQHLQHLQPTCVGRYADGDSWSEGIHLPKTIFTAALHLPNKWLTSLPRGTWRETAKT